MLSMRVPASFAILFLLCNTYDVLAMECACATMTDSLMVHSTPGLYDPTFYYMSRDECAELAGGKSYESQYDITWLQIYVDGKTGWVSGGWVITRQCSGNHHHHASPSTGTTGYACSNQADVLLIHASPGLNAPNIGTLSRGQCVQTTGNHNYESQFDIPWIEIQFNGQIGWVARNWVVFKQSNGHPAHTTVSVNGGWSTWGKWTSCTLSCNSGLQSRDRSCDNPSPQNGGHTCNGQDQDIRSCNTAACTTKVDGAWNSWSRWSTCSVTCGGGLQSRDRQCSNPRPQHGGTLCSGSSREERACNSAVCLGSTTLSWQPIGK